tara:strand:- start:1173 stop:1355 length:183 start_codon:yes stop_codon:yes gene_type:complete
MNKKSDSNKNIDMDGEITQESLELLAKKYNIKILPDDHPIYQEPPSIVLGTAFKNKKKEK